MTDTPSSPQEHRREEGWTGWTPILRVKDAAASIRFYCDVLGFNEDWVHRFGDDFPGVGSQNGVSTSARKTSPNPPLASTLKGRKLFRQSRGNLIRVLIRSAGYKIASRLRGRTALP